MTVPEREAFPLGHGRWVRPGGSDRRRSDGAGRPLAGAAPASYFVSEAEASSVTLRRTPNQPATRRRAMAGMR